MKRKLLYLTTIVLSAFTTINAQTTTWDLGNIGWTGPAAGVASGTPVINFAQTFENLTLVPHTSSTTYFGVVEANKPATFSDGFTATSRFKFNGGGSPSGNKPTLRFLTFNVSGPCTIKIWFMGSGESARNLLVTDGTDVFGNYPSANETSTYIETASYTGTGGRRIYIYGTNSFNLYKIVVNGATVTAPSLGVNDFQADAASNVFSNGKLVFVSNVKSDTEVDVYGISGVLVKSFKTGSDTSFDLNTGVYIVKSKSSEGEKTAKVLVN